MNLLLGLLNGEFPAPSSNDQLSNSQPDFFDQ